MKFDLKEAAGRCSIDDVKFSGKVWMFVGASFGAVKCSVAIESAEIKYDKTSSLLTVKFRTFYVDPVSRRMLPL